MARLIGLRPVWLPRGTLCNMARTIMMFFSPMAKISSIRLVLFMVVMHSWPFFQLDINNAFPYGDLAEKVYMEQPPGFVAQGESGLVCKLRWSLYGMKQSSRA